MKKMPSPLFRFTSTGPTARRLIAGLHLVIAVTVLTPFASLHAADLVERDALKVLTIGNSFADNATEFLPAIAKAGGKTLVLAKANLGGCSLERHASLLAKAEAKDPEGTAYDTFVDPNTNKKRKVSLPEALEATKWDVVTIQQWSQQSYKAETFHPHVDQLIAAIRKHAPQAEIVIHETWAYREDHPFFFKDDGFTPQKMYTLLAANYRQLAADTGFRIMPVGDAFNLARQTDRWAYLPDPGFDLKSPPEGKLPDQTKSLNVGWTWAKDKEGKTKFTLDAIHANANGRYLGAVVWYETLFNTSKAPENYAPKGVAPEDAAQLRELATAAVSAERTRAAAPAPKRSKVRQPSAAAASDG